jgi:tRNA U54 and U55 pseudouridine synthase Pus10
MESNFKTTDTGFKYSHFDIFNDNATKSKIYKHLIDINDTITEDDIRNVKVSFPDYDIMSRTKEVAQSGTGTIPSWDTVDATT